MTLSAKYVALFGVGGPNAYFPAVWFVEDESTIPPDQLWPEMVLGSCGGGYEDPRKKRREKRKLEEEEQEIEEIMSVICSFLHVRYA